MAKSEKPPLEAKEKKPKAPSVSIFQLFRFSTPKEKLMIVIATILSAATGALQPASMVIYGSFVSNLTNSLDNPGQILEKTLPVIRTMAYFGTAILFAAYISNSFWIVSGENQTRRIKGLYVHAVLRQEMSWFDEASEGSLNTRLATDTQLIQDGISEKFGRFIMFLSQFIGGFVVAFTRGTHLNPNFKNKKKINFFLSRMALGRNYVGSYASFGCSRRRYGLFYYQVYYGFPNRLCCCRFRCRTSV